MAKTRKPIIPKHPIYLKQVRIQNHAPLRDARVYFEQGLNIIIGPNGVGKTRFLGLTSQLTDWNGISRIGVGCELVLGYDQDIKVSFQQIPLDAQIDLALWANSPAELEVTVSYKKKKHTDVTLIDALWEVDLKNPLPETILAWHGTPLQRLPLADLSSTLIFGESSGVQVEPKTDFTGYKNWPLLAGSIFGALNSSFFWRRRYQRANDLPTTFSIEEARAEVERIVAAYLDFINPYLANYSPIEQIRLSSTYQVYDNTSQQEILIKGLVLEYHLDGNWLPFTAMSDGTKRILYLISQLVMPAIGFDTKMPPPMSINLFSRPRIILLEEPELGIHHAQLHKLLYLIKEVASENQVILTTHAPQVLDMLGADELDRITICSLDPEKGTQFHKLTEEKQEQARVYMKEVGFLSDYWRYSYLEETEAE